MFIVPCLEEGIVGEARPNNIIVIMIVKIIIIMIAKIITMIINISPEARPSCCRALRCRLDISRGCDLPEDWKSKHHFDFRFTFPFCLFFFISFFIFCKISSILPSSHSQWSSSFEGRRVVQVSASSQPGLCICQLEFIRFECRSWTCRSR